MFNSVQPHRRQPTRLPCPWDSPVKNIGVPCHFLLQCMEVKSKSEVAQLCPTKRDPIDCSLPVASIHGIFQARVLEWVAIAFSAAYLRLLIFLLIILIPACASCSPAFLMMYSVYRAWQPGMWSQVGLRKHHYEQSWGCDAIPVELYHILKDDSVKVLHSICQQIWRTQQWPQSGKGQVSPQFQRKASQRMLKLPHNFTHLSHY